MTEELQATGNQDIAAPVINESVSQAPTPSEKMVPQSVVDRTVQAIKKSERERGRQEALAEIQRNEVRAPEVQAASAPQSQTSMGGMGYLSPEEVRRMIEDHDRRKAEEFQAQTVKAEADKVSAGFLSQLEESRSKYPDFEEMEKQLDVHNNARLAPLIIAGHQAGITNMGDVLYDLWKNPAKVASLAGTMSDAAAISQLRRFSEDIKANEAAKSQPVARKPLSQMQVSMTATDNGTRTVSDFRRASWARA